MSLTISDDLRGVLEDLAASPKQTLFGGTLHQRLRLAMNAEPTAIGANPTGLSKVERHLVAMHRRELAKVLNQAFYAEFFKPAGPAGLFFARKAAKGVSEWAANASFARDQAPYEAFQEGTASWLHQLLEGKPLDTSRDFQGLLAASLRLTDSPHTRLFSGVAHQAFGQDQAALRTLAPLSRRAPEGRKLTARRTLQAIAVGDERMDYARRLGLITLKQLDKTGREDEVPVELATLAYRQITYKWDVPLPMWARSLANNQSTAFEQEFERIQTSTHSVKQDPWQCFGGPRP